MSIDLNRIQEVTTEIRALNNLALVSFSQNNFYQSKSNLIDTVRSGPKFMFHLEKRNEVNLKSSITDNFTEGNSVINDNIALLPEMVIVNGIIAELNNSFLNPQADEVLNLIEDKLVLFNEFAPNFSTSVLKKINQGKKIAQDALIVGTSRIEKSTLKADRSLQHEQQKAFGLFYGYWRDKTLFNVQTPWALFTDMVIESLNAVQKDDEYTSEFNITFKKLRFAKTTGPNPNDLQSRLNDQSSTSSNLGTKTLGNEDQQLTTSLNSFLRSSGI